MQILQLVHAQSNRVIGERIVCANTPRMRLIGLLGKSKLPEGEGVWLQPSSGVHTFGMRFAIDVLGLNQELRVVRLWPRLRPQRITAVDFKVRSAVELAPGTIEEHGIQLGDQLRFASHPQQPAQVDARRPNLPSYWL